MFQPRINVSRSAHSKASSSSSVQVTFSRGRVGGAKAALAGDTEGQAARSPSVPLASVSAPSYPVDCDPPSRLLATVTTGSEQSAGVSVLRLSRDGRYVAIGITDHCVSLLRYTTEVTPTCRVGIRHKGGIVALDWSQDATYFMSTSVDNTAVVWDAAKVEPVLVLSASRHNCLQRETDPPNPELRGVTRAQFYYLDKFILVAAEKQVNLYKYYIDAKVDDLNRFTTHSRYRLAGAIVHPSAQHISALAAPNTFYSYICLAAGTDKSLAVIDMNTSQVHRRR